MNNNSGKTITIFVVLTIILLASSTSIGFFLYSKAAQQQKQTQSELDLSRNAEMKMQAELKEAKRQLTIAADKNKEADEKINNLLEEIDLNEGLRKELKTENVSLKESLENAKKEKEKMKAELDAAQARVDGAQSKIDEAEKRYKEVQELYKLEQDKANALQSSVKQLEEFKAQAEEKIQTMKGDLKGFNPHMPQDEPVASRDNKVQLDKIVVDPNDGARGRVLSVDKEAEFIVCNLGMKKGVKVGDILSVYRGEEYLGDVKVSRVQEELSAADIIPPFSSRKVRKNDNVVFKP